ncbi:MAG TPA: NAD(P)/FAD-dependent oxidoreductase [Cytophagaceae bacterium]|jgi:predicted Rossmann fold flavoprotein|nr:NAD(P)/FAD-dependent oxidoreductase [Cytophagaceae bacterium]
MKIAVIGGGAAGFFGAIACAESNKHAEVTVFEKSKNLLSKVKVSGGGRCNVTHACFENNLLVRKYPRGSKELKKPFAQFSTRDTIKWFESKGVALKTEDDGRIFPVTDNSQTIIDCLMKSAQSAGVKIITSTGVKSIQKDNTDVSKFRINFSDEALVFDKVLIAIGGNPNSDSYQWFAALGHTVVPPVPSLFTFNIPDSKYDGLMGISVANASVKVAGVKTEQNGPLLITHWGLSGPAVLRLSAWEARTLADLNYHFSILINWIPEYNEESLREKLKNIKSDNPKKIISVNPLFALPKRLWERLVTIAQIPDELRWLDVSNKQLNKLIEELLRSQLIVKGKTTFKEEFVTCGGISLQDINLDTMESIKCPGMYFAGEVMDVDGITGGFNFQSAWTTGYIAGKSMAG